jgi:hypothetical protein
MNDFSNISAETPLRDEITVRSDEYDPIANPAYEGPMGIFTDYEGCDSADEGENLEDEGTVTEPDESMDGDHASALASAGMGCDEDYGYYGGDEGE